jgi:hypothetical protein
MKNLKELIPLKSQSKKIVKEEVSDLDATLPNMVEKFLEKLISQLKGYNLNRKKQVAVIAKVIDGLGMDKMELMRAIQKIKQAGALAEQENILNEAELDIKPGFKFFEIYDGHTMSGRGTISDIWQVTKDLGDDKFECKLVSTSGMGSTGHKKTFTKSQILKLVNPRRY